MRKRRFIHTRKPRKARVQFVYDAGETPALHTQRVDKTTLTEMQ